MEATTLNYELFVHNLQMLRSISWSEDRSGDKILLEYMHTAMAITLQNVKLPEIVRGFRVTLMKYKEIPPMEGWNVLISTVVPGYPELGKVVFNVNEFGHVMWINFGI